MKYEVGDKIVFTKNIFYPSRRGNVLIPKGREGRISKLYREPTPTMGYVAIVDGHGFTSTNVKADEIEPVGLESVESTYCYEGDETLEEALESDVQEFGFWSYRIVERHGGSGAWPEIEFRGTPEAIAKWNEAYDG